MAGRGPGEGLRKRAGSLPRKYGPSDRKAARSVERRFRTRPFRRMRLRYKARLSALRSLAVARGNDNNEHR